MSRGPGRWQRVVLAALEEHPFVALPELAVDTLARLPTESERVALHRAATSLARSGRIQCCRVNRRDHDSMGVTIAARTGIPISEQALARMEKPCHCLMSGSGWDACSGCPLRLRATRQYLAELSVTTGTMVRTVTLRRPRYTYRLESAAREALRHKRYGVTAGDSVALTAGGQS